MFIQESEELATFTRFIKRAIVTQSGGKDGMSSRIRKVLVLGNRYSGRRRNLASYDEIGGSQDWRDLYILWFLRWNKCLWATFKLRPINL